MVKASWILILCLAAGLATIASGSHSPLAVMDYHDVTETAAALASLDSSGGYVTRFLLGYSSNFKTNPAQPKSFPIYSIRISASTSDAQEDNPAKNGILFECGMHPREWLTSESCLALAEYLTSHRTDTASGVPELLRHVDVWIIPITTTAGRFVDDAHSGDPTQFYNTSPMEDGWRGNGDPRLCEWGVNVARNFSRGFNDPHATPYCGTEYRGFAPFSSEEANALRQFVENHSISMAIVLHTNAQQIWNQWGTGDVAGQRFINEAARIWRQGWANPADRTRFDLDRSSIGGGNGQFSAWLALPSEHSGGEISEAIGPWAAAGDIPLAGDFNSDGYADDVGIYRPSNAMWHFDYSHNGSTDSSSGPWAQTTTYRPFAGDFDGDGFSDDVAVLRLSDLNWFYDFNHNGNTNQTYSGCGHSDFIPLALDSDRDGLVDDRTAFRPSDQMWYYDVNHDCLAADSAPVGPWGLNGDLPFAGDFDRDGFVDDVGVFRPSTRVWYYDLDHDGDTDHVSGPWGVNSGQPVAGDYNRDSDQRLDDVGLFDPATSAWLYDDYHNAGLEQMDDGSRRAIQALMVELPFQGVNYYGTIYENAAGDGSNSFHPSGGPVRDVIANSFIPMALYLIRQARAPGCPTKADGTVETAYCPAIDIGIASARLSPEWAAGTDAGAFTSVAAERRAWNDITPAQMQVRAGTYTMRYQAQNFSKTMQNFKVRLVVSFTDCAAPGNCRLHTEIQEANFGNIPSQAAVQGTFRLDLNGPCGPGEWYQVSLAVSQVGGGTDGLNENDMKVFKFVTAPGAWVYLPLMLK